MKVSERMLNELGVHTVEDLFTQRHLLARVFSPAMFDFLMRVAFPKRTTPRRSVNHPACAAK